MVKNQLTDNYDFLGVEKLKVDKMIKDNKKKKKWYSNKRMLDSSLSSFLKKLIFKAEDAGKWVRKVNPRNTSQRCSNLKCRKLAKPRLEPKDRIFICAYCGLVLDRDVNASRNILHEAQKKEFGADFLISKGWLEPVWKSRLEDRHMLVRKG